MFESIEFLPRHPGWREGSPVPLRIDDRVYYLVVREGVGLVLLPEPPHQTEVEIQESLRRAQLDVWEGRLYPWRPATT